MNDNSKVNRPDLKYSNYFNETPHVPPADSSTGTRSIEKATWILLALCCIPFLGGLFALATIILGIILITRDRLKQGLIAIIVAPLACAAATILVFIFFIAAAGSAAAYQMDKAVKQLPELPAAPR